MPIADTPQFKAWFQGSEVVNPDGSPMVMYHATQSDFGEFRPYSHFGTQGAANARHDNLTNFYTDTLNNPSRNNGSQIMPVYLSIKNPLRMPDLASLDESSGSPLDEFDEAEDMDEDERPYARAWEGEEAVATTILEMGEIDIDEFEECRDNDAAYKFLEQKGYDGIVYKNVVEDSGKDSWIVFNPNQVKSAIGNNGEFNMGNSSITGSKKTAVYVEEQWEDILQKKGYVVDETTPSAWEDTLYINPQYPDVQVLLHESGEPYYLVELNGEMLEQGTDPEKLWNALEQAPEAYRKSIKHPRELTKDDYTSMGLKDDIGIVANVKSGLLRKKEPKMAFDFSQQPQRQYDYEASGQDVVLISPSNTTKLIIGDEAKNFWVGLDAIENQSVEGGPEEEYVQQVQTLIRSYFDKELKAASKYVVKVDAKNIRKGASVAFVAGVTMTSDGGSVEKLKFTTKKEKAAAFSQEAANKLKGQLADFSVDGTVVKG